MFWCCGASGLNGRSGRNCLQLETVVGVCRKPTGNEAFSAVLWRFRYIAICHPMRAQATNTVRRARRITLGLWTAGIIYCSPWLALSTTEPKHLDDGRSISMCTFTLPRGHYLIYYMADLIIFYAVPLLTATVLYGLIARTLYSAAAGPTPDGRGSMRQTGNSIGVGGVSSLKLRVSTFRRNGVGGAARRRSTFLRQQSSISMSSANASNSRIQVCRLSLPQSPQKRRHKGFNGVDGPPIIFTLGSWPANILGA